MATKSISTTLDLAKAFRDVMRDERRGRDLLPDALHFLDSAPIKDDIIAEIKTGLDSPSYRVQPVLRMEVPKDTFFVRPARRPCLKDWVLYHALATFVGQKTNNRLQANVFSCRFDRRSGRLLHGVKQWRKFEKAFWRCYDSGYRHVLKTDITSYFANIGLERLRQKVVSMITKSDEVNRVLDLLFDQLLRTWSEEEVNKYFGLPQGINPSSILANLYLDNIDVLFSRNRNLRYFRYSDDMRVLAKNKVNVKVALKELTNALRDIGLDLNEKKTQILDPEDANRKLRDPRSQDMDVIQSVLDNGSKSTIIRVAVPLLHDLFERSFDSTNLFGGRHLRFSLNCFVRLRGLYESRTTAVTDMGLKFVERLEAMPGASDVFAHFFGTFPVDDFRKPLVGFLKSPDNIYSWQEMWILDALLRFERVTSTDLDLFRHIASDKDKHSLSRSKATILLGKFGDEHERYELRRKFRQETDHTVRRATIIATQELSASEKNNFYSTVKKLNPEQTTLVQYLKRLPTPVYYDDYLPDPYALVDEVS